MGSEMCIRDRLLGGGVGGLAAEQALRAMLSGYLRAYDEIDALIFS